MTVIRWTNGVPPATRDPDLTYRLILWRRTSSPTARLMLVRGLAPGAVLHQTLGFGYLASPVVPTVDAHVDTLEIVPNEEIIGQWTARIPPESLAAHALRHGASLEWRGSKEVS